MKEQLVNSVMSILGQGILSIVGVFATALMTIAVQYLNKKKEAVVNKIGIDNYNHIYNVAKATFFAVEQNFSGLSGMGEQKRKMFDSMLLQKMPHLTQQELDHFREGVAGELNHQLKQSQLLGPAAAKVEIPATAQLAGNCNTVSPSDAAAPNEVTENPTTADVPSDTSDK